MTAQREPDAYDFEIVKGKDGYWVDLYGEWPDIWTQTITLRTVYRSGPFKTKAQAMREGKRKLKEFD